VSERNDATRPRYVALLRAISNVGMQSFRRALEELGFADVESYGMSGNLLFNAKESDKTLLERRIATRFRTVVIVRRRSDLTTIVAQDPYRSTILFLASAPTAARRQAFFRLDFDPPRPVLRGRTLYFVHPSRLRGKRTPLDFERMLGCEGTARSARVVIKLLARMRGADERLPL